MQINLDKAKKSSSQSSLVKLLLNVITHASRSSRSRILNSERVLGNCRLSSSAHDAQSGKTSLSTTQTALQSGYGSLRGTLFIFLLKIKTGTLFGHSSSTQCLHAASSGTKRINNNKNSRTRGRKSGGVEDQPQPRRLWRSRTPNARSLSRPSSFPPSSHNLSFPRVHWCVMGRLVHRSPVSSYLIAQVPHPFPHATRTAL